MLNQEQIGSCQAANARQLLQDAGVDVAEADILRIAPIHPFLEITSSLDIEVALNHMDVRLAQVKDDLQKHGLYVAEMREDALWIALNPTMIAGTDVPISRHPCVLEKKGEHWVASFCTYQPLMHDVAGTLAEMSSLVIRTFKQFSSGNMSMAEALVQSGCNNVATPTARD